MRSQPEAVICGTGIAVDQFRCGLRRGNGVARGGRLSCSSLVGAVARWLSVTCPRFTRQNRAVVCSGFGVPVRGAKLFQTITPRPLSHLSALQRGAIGLRLAPRVCGSYVIRKR